MSSGNIMLNLIQNTTYSKILATELLINLTKTNLLKEVSQKMDKSQYELDIMFQDLEKEENHAVK